MKSLACLFFLAFTIFSCADTSNSTTDENINDREDNSTENTVQDANTTIEDHGEKLDVIALGETLEELNREIDAGEMLYKVGKSEDPMVLEYTAHYIEESQEFKKLLVIYATGSGKRFYWLGDNVTILEDSDLRYIFKNGEFKALDDGVSDVKTSLAETMQAEVTKLMAQAQKIVSEEIVLE